MDFDEINPAAVLFGVVGLFIGIFVSNSMGTAGVVGKILIGIICGVACYFLSNIITNN